jgi:hypothetical protein
LGRVQNEIKCLDSTDSPSDCDTFTPYHAFPQYICPARLDSNDGQFAELRSEPEASQSSRLGA